MFKLPFVIMRRNSYDELVKKSKQVVFVETAGTSIKFGESKGRWKKRTMKGRWTQYDPLPLEFAIANLEKQFKNELLKDINPKVEVEVKPDGVTRDVVMTYEWYDIPKKEG